MNIQLLFAVAATAAFLAQGKGVKVCWEAESAKILEPPAVRLSTGCEGASGAFVEIPEGAGNPPARNEGKAVYEIEISETGSYWLWARVWWNGECSNSFTVTIDDKTPFLFGEDATYRTWHWVKYPVSRMAKPVSLEKGRHTVVFANREDGVRVDQILLSSDRRFVPSGIEK